MNDLMIDIETLGTRPNAAIISIGAVLFNPFSGEIGDWLYTSARVDSDNCSVDHETLKWWMKQPNEAREQALQGEKTLATALFNLSTFIDLRNDRNTISVWSKSPSFDLVILRSAYRRTGLDVKWQYRNEKDVRTCIDIGEKLMGARPRDIVHKGTTHNALDDAIHQANQIIEVYSKATLGKKHDMG